MIKQSKKKNYKKIIKNGKIKMVKTKYVKTVKDFLTKDEWNEYVASIKTPIMKKVFLVSENLYYKLQKCAKYESKQFKTTKPLEVLQSKYEIIRRTEQ